MKENLIKFVLIFGSGFGLFILLKKMNEKKSNLDKSTGKASADGTSTAPDLKNAEIVAGAYSEALKAGETPQRLTELNKELTKEFGMRCYVSEDGKLIVCDVKGNTIFTK